MARPIGKSKQKMSSKYTLKPPAAPTALSRYGSSSSFSDGSSSDGSSSDDFPEPTAGKSVTTLKTRNRANHAVTVWQCSNPDTKCAYFAANATALKKHNSLVHNIGVEWWYCDLEDCAFKTKMKCDLVKHKILIHEDSTLISPGGRGAEWQECKSCNYKTRVIGNLTRHVEEKHAAVKPVFKCDLCEHTTLQKAGLKKHMLHKHPDPNAELEFGCGLGLCTYRSTTAIRIKLHQQSRHNIGVVWRECENKGKGCTFKTKLAWNLKVHEKGRCKMRDTGGGEGEAMVI